MSPAATRPSTAPRALITGITGQDGSYLAELLLAKGYEVYGMMRRSSSFNTARIDHLYQDPHERGRRLRLVFGDLNDASSLNTILRETQPDEIYHLAAQSHVRVSFEIPEYTVDSTALGTLRLLEAIRATNLKPKFYQASSSEMFGQAVEIPQRESTPFHPRSPYACAKVFAYHTVCNYREAYGFFACNGILFNHESPRRGETFVSRKITRAATRIKLGLQETLYLGNLKAKRDWGYAPEYCLDEATEILTDHGFKSYHEIRVGDVIVNFNRQKNRVEKDVILKKHLFDYDGKMFVFEGRGVNIQCTPEHRIIFQAKSKRSKGGWSRWDVCTAREFAERLSGKAKRTRYDYRLPGLHGYDAERIAIRDEELKLVGYLAAEGHLKSAQGNGRGVTVSLSQSWKANPRYYQDIKRSIHALGLEYHERKRQDGCSEFLFNAESTRRLLDLYDGYEVHRLPAWIMRGSPRQLDALLTTMMNGDGSWGSMTYVSVNPGLISDFQTVAVKLGYRTLVHQRRSGIYECALVSKRKVHAYVTDVHEVPYRGKVWCVTTKNGSMVIRKDHCVSVVGNCEAMWRMLQQDTPDDYVIATGETHTVEEFVAEAFGYLSLDWRRYIQQDPRYLRPTEVDVLVGDATKARAQLGWRPSVTFQELVRLMVEADLELAERETYAKGFPSKTVVTGSGS